MPLHRSLRLAGQAEALQAVLPPLLIEAERVAAVLLQGTHGRKRAGPGESFWQYRDYVFGDATQRIDWRKSARGQRVLVRENEWETANTLWLWVQNSPGMDFTSSLASVSKGERASLLALTLASLALRGHERVALAGSPERPAQSRSALLSIARRMLGGPEQTLPGDDVRLRNSTVVLFGDFLQPLDQIGAAFSRFASRHVAGHIVQINDPAEADLPYEGRVKFIGMEDTTIFTANRTQDLRAAYLERFMKQREGLREMARRLGWSFLCHHTDKPTGPALMALHSRLRQDR